MTLAERVLHLSIKAPLIHLDAGPGRDGHLSQPLEIYVKAPLLHIFLETIALVGWLWTLTARNTVVLHKSTL